VIALRDPFLESGLDRTNAWMVINRFLRQRVG